MRVGDFEKYLCLKVAGDCLGGADQDYSLGIVVVNLAQPALKLAVVRGRFEVKRRTIGACDSERKFYGFT